MAKIQTTYVVGPVSLRKRRLASRPNRPTIGASGKSRFLSKSEKQRQANARRFRSVGRARPDAREGQGNAGGGPAAEDSEDLLPEDQLASSRAALRIPILPKPPSLRSPCSLAGERPLCCAR